MEEVKKDEVKTEPKPEVQKYDCVCFKCKKDYESENKMDLDGEGYCPPCKLKKEEVAKRVDEIIAARRAQRGERPKPVEPQTIPGTKWINARQFL